MALDLLGHFPHLLLLLGLWGPMHPLFAVPPNLTGAQWFQIQHLRPSPLPCNQAMRGVNSYTYHCKGLNTFLHDSFHNVAAVCNLANITCRNRSTNCHQSQNRVNMTVCNLTAGRDPNCNYNSAAAYKFFIVACNTPQVGGPPYPFVPVHLDGVI
ncbi:ribonuclease K3-like [Elephas maximus indicus]|uniref:ribonuclease K3-like n=1 Tax=Elephas maximus indicus TaxID=99487 RepID=UPI002116E175|nr:ribonuclease K3-like [Elephas maximus indicus]XP_049754105.1 ribonuclease K3-like [Elephas maximus indicus]XP_049754106.1 ribonuclease K3-like [Elephas maximus indicus]XP_049754107.1 ribonuclease K3-like [Elephas maximus indicus]